MAGPGVVTPPVSCKDTAAAFPSRCSFPPPLCRIRESGWIPRESLDAPEDLPKEGRGQVALGQLEDEVPGMSDESSAGLEEPQLETRNPAIACGQTASCCSLRDLGSQRAAPPALLFLCARLSSPE